MMLSALMCLYVVGAGIAIAYGSTYAFADCNIHDGTHTPMHLLAPGEYGKIVDQSHCETNKTIGGHLVMASVGVLLISAMIAVKPPPC